MRKISRRRFLGHATTAAGATLAAPYIIPSSALGLNGAVPPSERITIAAIGVGGRCRSVLEQVLDFEDAQFVAVCDCWNDRLRNGKEMVDARYGNNDCAAYSDFLEVLARDDIDAVMVETGDRWHALVSTLAAKAGKDVWCEKPMTLTIAEGREVADAVRRYGTVFQCSHQRRSVDSYKFIVEVVHKGLIGEVHTITTSLFGGNPGPVARPCPIPPGWGDYDRWLGPAPHTPFSHEILTHWKNHWDYAGGPMTDMGAHLVDIAQWGNRSELSAPVEYEPGEAVWPKEGIANTPIKSAVYCRYADGVKLNILSGQLGDFNADRWTKFEGTEGWVCQWDYDSSVKAEPKSILKIRGVDPELWANNANHFQNWLDCIKTGAQTICPAENSHRTTTICHIANISLRLGRHVRWNPGSEQFTDDPEANSMISRPLRAPWHV